MVELSSITLVVTIHVNGLNLLFKRLWDGFRKQKENQLNAIYKRNT